MSEAAMQTTPEVSIERTPEVIAAEINTIKAHVRQIAATASIEIGGRLVEAKAKVKHGEWGKWLQENVNFSHSQANTLMQLHNQFGSNPQALGNMNYSQAIALIGVSEEGIEQLKETHDVENMSSRELKKAVKDLQEAEKRATEAEAAKKAAEEKAAQEQRTREEYEQKSRDQKIELERLEKELSKAKDTGDDAEVKKLQQELSTAKGDLSEYQKKIKDLEEALKEKPIEAAATVTVEVIPEQTQNELANLRAKVAAQAELETQLTDLQKRLELSNNEPVVKFKVRFEAISAQFKELMTALGEVPEDKREKLKEAVKTLVGRMAEKL